MQVQGTIPNLFWANTAKTALGCWEWQGTKNRDGYGVLKFCRTVVSAHRVAYEFANGPITDGLYVCHHCDNRLCVRPDHLFLGGALENNRDASRKGRYANRPAPNRPRGTEQPGSKLTDDAVREIRRAHADGGVTYGDLAARFGVSWSLIRNVVKRLNWKHVA